MLESLQNRVSAPHRYWQLSARLLLSAGLFFLVWRELPESALFSGSKLLSHQLWLQVALLLLPANYLLETIKWRQLLRKPIRPGLIAAFGHVLVGQASGFMTPNRLGDYAGRVLGFAPSHRLEAASATFSSRLAQLPATLFGGLLAAVPLVFRLDVRWQFGLLSVGVLLVLVLMLMPVISRGSLLVLGQLIQQFRPSFAESLARLKPYEGKTLLRLITLSLLRYVIFTLQYALLIKWLLPELAWGSALQLPALVFAAKTFIPSFAFAELGIRESLAIVVAGLLGIHTQAAFEATLVLFIFNVLVPAAAGCLVVLFGKRAGQITQVHSPDASAINA